jgi:hypothetical protein
MLCLLSCVLCLSASALVSCRSTGHPFDIDPVVERGVQVWSYSIDNDYQATGGGAWANISGAPPIRLATTAGGTTSSYKDPSPTGQTITKVEMDYGDGSGWRDVTYDYNHKWDFMFDTDGPDLSTWDQYNYTEPGTYTIRGRVTYWDGEVVYSRPETEVTVTVSAP